MVAMLSLLGTLVGTLAGIWTSSRLSVYRIEQLEKKVDKHNNLIERVYRLEKQSAVTEEEIRVANQRISDLENEL